jgi:hypothetical protein
LLRDLGGASDLRRGSASRSNGLNGFPKTNGMKSVVRRMLRSAVRRAREFLREEPVLPAPDFANADFAYTPLNCILERGVRQSQGRLRPNYTWGVLQAAYQAKVLGIPRISVMECGVAGGNGLIAMEYAADLAEQELGVGIDVWGFDTGAGLPPPLDYRDQPNLWAESNFRMDVDKLKKRLRRAQLKLGLIGETMPIFLASNPAPIGFISIDVDYYTSTLDVFKALEANQSALMPRIHCYFDDITGFTHSEFTGERLAINEFNDSHTTRKIAPIYGLRFFLPKAYANEAWSEAMYIAYIFDHKLYGRNDGSVLRTAHDHTALA